MRSLSSLAFLILLFVGFLGLQSHALEHGFSEANHCEICCGQVFEISGPPAQNLYYAPANILPQQTLSEDSIVLASPQLRLAPPRGPPRV